MDRTRLPQPGLDAAGTFGLFIRDWTECHGALLDAAGTLRLDGSEPEALAALLVTAPVRQLAESWELWRLWAGSTQSELDRRLARHLGEDRVAWLRFALGD